MVEEILPGIVIGVLQGGVSSERDISLLSGEQVMCSLKRSHIKAVGIEVNTCDERAFRELIVKSNIDAAFIALHGEFGEDGTVQGILDDMSIPYTGSGEAASYNSMDKIISKGIFQKTGVPTPRFFAFTKNGGIPVKGFSYPFVVKPYSGGSSIGITIVKEKRRLGEALEHAFSSGEKALIEEYIEGREYTVGILDEIFLGVVEILPKTEYYDFSAKYTEGMVEFIAPAQLSHKLYRTLQEIALRAHSVLGCCGFSRVDMRLTKDNIPFVLEVNSIPGLTSHSLLPLSAKCCGINFDELIKIMLELSLKKRMSSLRRRKA